MPPHYMRFLSISLFIMEYIGVYCLVCAQAQPKRKRSKHIILLNLHLTAPNTIFYNELLLRFRFAYITVHSLHFIVLLLCPCM